MGAVRQAQGRDIDKEGSDAARFRLRSPQEERDTAMGQASEEDIRRRAYELWVAEGQPHGKDRDHWEQATREVGADTEESAEGDKPKATIGTMRATAEPAAEEAMEEIATEAAKGTVSPEDPAPAPAPAAAATPRKPRSRKA